MRPASLFLRVPRLLTFAALLFTGALAASSQTTTFTGQVYSPLGTAGDPIPNILTFIQDPNSPLPVFAQGVAVPSGGQTGCEAQPSLVPSTVLGQALTDATGTYTFTVTGPLPTTINFVIQAGKWRRQTQYPSSQFLLGQVNQMPALSMPSQQGAGVDLPHIAVVTGSADNIECIFRQIGIKDTEITDPSGGGSVNLFLGDGSGGEIVSNSTPSELALVNPNASGAVPMTNYDLVMFGCQGDSTSDSDPLSYTSTIEDYTSDGGRIFLTHFEYPWLRDSSVFAPIADWYTPKSKNSNDSETGELSPSYSGYSTLSAWMQDIGALNISTSPPEFTLSTVREDATAVHPPAQVWATVPGSPYNGAAVQFTFDTPIGASGTPTLSITYTNNATQFLRGHNAYTVNLLITNSGKIATTAGLKLTLTLPASTIATNAIDSSGGSWICSTGNPTTTCTLPKALAPNGSDSIQLTFNIPTTAQLGPSSIIGLLSGGGLNNSGQCGRVLYNDYHVEASSKLRTLYSNGAHCGTSATLTVAQKFLEYSLYNLSNFISPSTTDTILIQDYAPVTWSPAATYPYGTPKSAIQTASSTVAGQWTYTYTPAANDPPDVLTGGANYTVVATFTPNDTTDYLSNSLTRLLSITPDQTDAIISNLENPIYYGEEIGYDTRPGIGLGDAILGVYITGGYTPWIGATPATGPYSLTLAGKVVCTGSEETGINDPSRQTACPDSNFQGYDVGQYAMQLTYLGNNDYLGSISDASKTIVVVNPDPTAASLALSSPGSVVHDTVTATATIVQTITYVSTIPTGTATFYESANPVAANTTGPAAGSATLGTATLDPTGKATLPLSNLFIGTHNIYACFTSTTNKSGTQNFLPSCSASSVETVITPPPAPLITATLLRTSADPSPQGSPVSFTANVETTGAFILIPGGTVTFYDGTTSIGTATLDATGSAILTTSTLTLGTHPITVSYAGSTYIAASTSASLPEIIVDPLTAAGTGFLLQINPTTVPVFVGSTGTAAIQVIALTNFNEPVELSCTGLPAQSSCIFSQSLIPVGGGTTELLVSSGAPHNCGENNPFLSTLGGNSAFSLLLLSGLTLCFARRRRKLQGFALAVLLLTLPAVLTGCSGSNCTDFAVKPGDYQFTITAHSTGPQNITKTQTMVMHVHL